MHRDEYDEWADRHGSTFGLVGEADIAMFHAWFDVFSASGYTAAELTAATAAVAQQPPRFRSEHLGAIHAAIRDRRARAEAVRLHDPAEVSERGTCALCGESGWVVVPHPKCVAAGEWVAGMEGVTAAVTCSCFVGRRQLDAWDAYAAVVQKRVPRPMSLEYYQGRLCSRWRALLARHEGLTEAHRRAQSASRRADMAGGPLAGVIRRITKGVSVDESPV
jgi:hypothetical protein